MSDDAARDLLRHALATVAYRGAKVLRDAPADFPDLVIGAGTRTPARILAHIGDLFDWAISLADGTHVWHDSAPGPWPDEVARFHARLEAFDEVLAAGTPLGCAPGQLLQGPIADALTHIGQLAFLRRLADAPVRGENYFRADIAIGRLGGDQSAPRREFD